MEAFWPATALVLLGVFIGPMAFRLLRIPGRMRQLRRETERALVDHAVWLKRKHRGLLRELREVDEVMNARNMYQSSVHLRKRADVVERYQDALEDDWRDTIRRIQDAGSFVGWPERFYFRWRMENRAQPSVESQLIQGAVELAEQQLEDERRRLADPEPQP